MGVDSVLDAKTSTRYQESKHRYRILEYFGIESPITKIQDIRKKFLKLSLTKKNHFAYIQKEEIDRWFSTFIAEVRRVDGDQYPPRNIHKLLSGILHSSIYYSCDTPNVGSCEIHGPALLQP